MRKARNDKNKYFWCIVIRTMCKVNVLRLVKHASIINECIVFTVLINQSNVCLKASGCSENIYKQQNRFALYEHDKNYQFRWVLRAVSYGIALCWGLRLWNDMLNPSNEMITRWWICSGCSDIICCSSIALGQQDQQTTFLVEDCFSQLLVDGFFSRLLVEDCLPC